MNKILEIVLIVLAVAAVAVADALAKKVGVTASSFSAALKNPLMLAVAGLYVVQIIIFTYVFFKKAELGAVGIIQTALYALIVIGAGVIFFKEEIGLVQGMGMVLAVVGVILTSL